MGARESAITKRPTMLEGPSRRGQLRSRHSLYPAFATFINKTQRNVDLEWLNFQGDHKSYKSGLKPEKEWPMNTYKGHPWVFYESDTRHPLCFLPDRELIYFPVEWDGGQRVYHQVQIVSPLHSLQQLCMNCLHRHISVDQRNKSVESFSRIIDRLQLDHLLTGRHGDILKRMSRDQNYTNIPIYVSSETDENDD